MDYIDTIIDILSVVTIGVTIVLAINLALSATY